MQLTWWSVALLIGLLEPLAAAGPEMGFCSSRVDVRRRSENYWSPYTRAKKSTYTQGMIEARNKHGTRNHLVARNKCAPEHFTPTLYLEGVCHFDNFGASRWIVACLRRASAQQLLCVERIVCVVLAVAAVAAAAGFTHTSCTFAVGVAFVSIFHGGSLGSLNFLLNFFVRARGRVAHDFRKEPLQQRLLVGRSHRSGDGR